MEIIVKIANIAYRKMKAVLAAKGSPVRWGSQMCLIISGDFKYFLYVCRVIKIVNLHIISSIFIT